MAKRKKNPGKTLLIAGLLVIGSVVAYNALKKEEPKKRRLPDPWKELDAFIAKLPESQPIVDNGRDKTKSGVPYAWRIYSGGDSVIFQAIVRYYKNTQWNYWGDDLDMPTFKLGGSVEIAKEKNSRLG